ncbi:MAG: hypothetical protein U0905_18380 [Pirellulales bacterium]
MRSPLSCCMFLSFLWLAIEKLDAQETIPPTPQRLSPHVQESIASIRDRLGEEAMAQENGPSYEYFENLLPPPRYVHADFRFYPLVLAAPGNPVKARVISNGSGVNLRGGSKSWKDEGTPIAFRVGPDEFRFGGLVDRVSHPSLRDGWLPIYEIQYQHAYPVQSEGMVPIDQKPVNRPPEIYRQEFFVTTDPKLAEHAIVYVRFSLAQGTQGTVTVQRDPPVDRVPEGNYWFDEHGDGDRHGCSMEAFQAKHPSQTFSESIRYVGDCDSPSIERKTALEQRCVRTPSSSHRNEMARNSFASDAGKHPRTTCAKRMEELCWFKTG